MIVPNATMRDVYALVCDAYRELDREPAISAADVARVAMAKLDPVGAAPALVAHTTLATLTRIAHEVCEHASAPARGRAMTLTGSRCQCTACGEYFTSERTFSGHRVGDYATRRRCLPVAELVAAGWMRNARGFWTNKPLKGAHFDVAGTRKGGPLPTPRHAPIGTN